MPGRGTTAPCLPTGRPALESPFPWLGMELIKVILQ